MDLKGSLIDTNLKLYPTKELLDFLRTIPNDVKVPKNLTSFTHCTAFNPKSNSNETPIHLTQKEVDFLHEINLAESEVSMTKESYLRGKDTRKNPYVNDKKHSDKISDDADQVKCDPEKKEKPYLLTSDIDWLYKYLKDKRCNGNTDIPYIHDLLEGISIDLPENKVIKRNPVLEERCKKLRSQQEAREYRSMTRGVDNVRMKYPEDSISYQLKNLNRQLIAVGQFIISIFAGFLFGFTGVELMIGNLDFGFRLLLGVMCALVIAIAEIYFLAKKLNEELNIAEPVQLGGPLRFADDVSNQKEHQE